MTEEIFQTFYDKLPDSIEQVMPHYDGPFTVTFLTPRYMCAIDPKFYDVYKRFDYICSDGMMVPKINRWFGKKKTERISFDMTSLAQKVFEELNENRKGLYILGSEQQYVEKFVGILTQNFKNLNIVGFHNGYIKGKDEPVLYEVIKSHAKVVIIGQGAPLQDNTAQKLIEMGYTGTIYTCGGFIHQTSSKLYYYPKWVNKYNMRFFYRLFKEKGMIKRNIAAVIAFIKYAIFIK